MTLPSNTTNDEVGRAVDRWQREQDIAKGRALPSWDEFQCWLQNAEAAQSTIPQTEAPNAR